MNATASDLVPFAQSLEKVLAEGDADRFEEYLRGRHLPALGGDSTPAEILGSALAHLPSFPPDVSAQFTARILAHLVRVEALRLREEGCRDERFRAVLLGALQLASSLPAEPGLATALMDLLSAMRGWDEEERALGEEPFPIWLALWRALARQQTDDSLEPEWIALLTTGSGEWTPGRRTLLLEAWKGFLRMPPGTATQEAGEVIDFERIERGLLGLQATLEGLEGGTSFLGAAFELLMSTFPRSQEFWVTRWKKRFLAWPEDLRVEACRLLPTLAASSGRWYARQRERIESRHSAYRVAAVAEPAFYLRSGPLEGAGFFAAERPETLQKVVASLPPRTRQCFQLRYHQDLKYKEIAEAMEVSVETVKQHLNEARRHLKKSLEELEESSSGSYSKDDNDP